MDKLVKVATIQPPIPKGEKGGIISHNQMIQKGLSLLEEAGKEKTDIVCLPEIFNVFGLSAQEAFRKVSICDPILDRICEMSKKYHMYVIYPAFEKRGASFYISAFIINRKGKVIGKYDKTHPTRVEKINFNVVPGKRYQVFKTDFGKIGVMICYDCYFPEVARILTRPLYPKRRRDYILSCFAKAFPRDLL